MKERFELVYYIVFMVLMTGGLGAGIIDEIWGYAQFEKYIKYIGVGFLMTLARFIYNGQHFWNLPFKRPNIFIILLFVVVSIWLVSFAEIKLI